MMAFFNTKQMASQKDALSDLARSCPKISGAEAIAQAPKCALSSTNDCRFPTSVMRFATSYPDTCQSQVRKLMEVA
eukprot:COSAG06_NODE_574_length_14079_cov_6.802504_16_plen_76_part_00